MGSRAIPFSLVISVRVDILNGVVGMGVDAVWQACHFRFWHYWVSVVPRRSGCSLDIRYDVPNLAEWSKDELGRVFSFPRLRMVISIAEKGEWKREGTGRES